MKGLDLGWAKMSAPLWCSGSSSSHESSLWCGSIGWCVSKLLASLFVWPLFLCPEKSPNWFHLNNPCIILTCKSNYILHVSFPVTLNLQRQVLLVLIRSDPVSA